MNQNPNTLALALVHQAVQASELQEAQQAVAAQAERIKELQGAVDSLAKDRQDQKKTYEDRLNELTALSNSNSQALIDAAAYFGFDGVSAMMDAVRLGTPAPAPMVVESEGGEAA